MSEFQHKASESVSRRRAAERLTDIAYALTAGDALSFRADGETLSVPVADEVRLKFETKSEGEHVEFELELSWSSAHRPGPADAWRQD
jgi:amphi-Trp domain-containing protein